MTNQIFIIKSKLNVSGELAFLLDTIQRPFEFQGTPKELFEKFINSHNADVEEQKRFKVRNITVTDNNNYINRGNGSYSTTWESINDKLINTNGGYLETGTLEGGERFIDYISEYTEINPQTIEFGRNLLDITQYAKGEDIKTAIIPIGKDKLNISDINNGKDYIFNETAVNLFGWIFDTVEYNDVTLPENLLKKGNEYLETVINEKLTIELSAVDLHYLNCDISKYKKGDWVRVISTPHKLDKLFQVTKLSISLDDPKSSKLTLNRTFDTLTKNQLNSNKIIQESVNIATIENEKVKKEVSTLKGNVENLDDQVKQINTIVTEVPSEYVKNSTFENYKLEVNQKLFGIYTVKGSLANFEALETIANVQIGDVYNLLDTGANYVYTDSGWDKLSETIDFSNYYTKEEIDELIEQIKGGTE